MKRHRTLSPEFYTLDLGSEPYYYNVDGDVVETKDDIREKLFTIDGDDRDLACYILDVYEDFHKEKYKEIEFNEIVAQYTRLSDKGKDIVRFTVEESAKYLLNDYKRKMDAQLDNYNYVAGTLKELDISPENL